MEQIFENGSRLVAYLRDSGGDRQELSIEQQRVEIARWAKSARVVIVQWFVDEAQSAGTAERPAFQAMMDWLQSRRGADVDGVIVWSWSRFSRDMTDAQYYRSLLRRLGYQVRALHDPAVTGPEGQIIEALMDYVSEKQRADISRQARRGLHHIVQLYGAVPGTPPAGFKRVPVEIGRHRDGTRRIVHRWAVDEAQARKIRRAFEMRAAGCSQREIHERLHIHGSVNSYTTMFRNPIYIGELHYGGLVIPDYCEPIVPRDVWEQVAAIRAQNAARHGKAMAQVARANSPWMLAGILDCGLCGAPMYGNEVAGRRYYRCSRAHRRAGCNARAVSATPVEQAILRLIDTHWLTEDNLDALRRRAKYQAQWQASDNEMARSELEAAIRTNERRIQRLVDAIADFGHDAAMLSRLQSLREENDRLRAQLDALSHPPRVPDLDELHRLARAARQVLYTGEPAAVRRVLQGLVLEARVHRDGQKLRLEIVLNADAAQMSGVVLRRYAPKGRHAAQQKFEFEIAI